MIRSADDVALTAAELRSWRIDGAVILGTFASEAEEVQARLAMPLVFVDNRRAERPTGIFATADIIAIGLLKGLLDAGLTVPGDVSLVGFDDLPEARYVSPSLTTVLQDIPAKAEAAVATLLGMIEGGAVAGTVCLDVYLVERGSVARFR